MTPSQLEPWLRGPLPGVPPLLQPAAHALVMAREEIDERVTGLTTAQLWARPGGVASIGFHLAHVAGSTDRLLTYARGESITRAQFAALAAEREVDQVRPSVESLLETWHLTAERALQQIAGTPESTLLEPRTVGRDKLPSTVLGLIFHSAEHARSHASQVVTTAIIVRGAQ
jgi:hypothetical protein